MANTRVKVRREVLIEKLEVERKRLIAAHDADVKTAASERKVLLEDLSLELKLAGTLIHDDPDTVLRRLEGYYRSGSRDGLSLKFPRLQMPLEPPERANTLKIDRMLAILRNAEDETLSVAAEDDYARYL